MERFAALVASRRPAPAAASAAEERSELESEEGGEAYMSIRLEEIVIVKNDAYDAAARVAVGVSAVAMEEKKGVCGDDIADAASPAAAARGAWTTVTRIVGFD
uniref:Uncharacterized protein n=1 Tax=Leersia perrieri TaxID=77586 RepID=A0A0D9XD58_9ORYZ